MLHIVRVSGNDEWHVGDPTPDANFVFEIQVDGHELEHIKASFQNLPFPKEKRVVRFPGEMAKFILLNL